MSEHPRMLDGGKPPEPRQVAEWIGSKGSAHWAELTEFIESQYPGVLDRTWWFGGKKWGWSLRFKKSRSLCNLIPERGQFKALLVFGAEEREKVEAVLPHSCRLTSETTAREPPLSMTGSGSSPWSTAGRWWPTLSAF